MTKTALSRRTGLTTRLLYDYEEGRAEPSEASLQAIAEVLRFPSAFFYRPELEEPTPDGASFRSLKSMTAAQRDMALAAGALAFELNQWVDEHFELPSPKLPDLRGHDPETAAMTVRGYWGIGERPIGNMVHVLESHGVRVFSLAEQGREVDAFSLWHGDTPFVFLNTMKTAEHSRMDAAHELGHLLLHRHGAPQGRDLEKDALAFGAAFLMPRGSVLAQTARLIAPTLPQLIQLKKNWKVSTSALAHRLHGLRLLSDWSYRQVCIQIARLGRSNEPEGVPRETSQVFAKVFGALKQSGITQSDVARQLGLYTEDIEALIFGLVLSPASEGHTVHDPTAVERRRRFRVV